MRINLSEVLTEPHISVETEAVCGLKDISFGGQKYPVRSAEPFSVRVEWTGEQKFHVHCEGSLTVDIPCDRCLADVPTVFSVQAERDVNLGENCGEDEDGSEEANYIDGYYLDADVLICKEILAGWPMKVLCSEDCKGICSVCGRNLNEGTCDCEDPGLDPRMSVIRDVFKNFKEV